MVNAMRSLWNIFLNGLFTILPLVITIALFRTTIRLAKLWLFDPLHDSLRGTLFHSIPYSEVILVIGIIFIIGLITHFILLRSIIHAVEALIFKIPLVRPVYSGTKQLVDAFSSQEKLTFKRVVLVQFPRPGIYSIGFVTSEMPPAIAPDANQVYFNIFIPTTPNPTTGFFIVLPKSDISVVNLTRQEAMAMIISGGIILPDRFN